MIARLIMGAALGLTLTGTAFAQSYNAPAGIPAATAPGGLDGQAGVGNADRYFDRYGRPLGGIYTTGTVVVPNGPYRTAR